MAGEDSKIPDDFYITSDASSAFDADARDLANIGKKAVLRRNLTPLAILGFSCTLMVTWEGLFSVFIFGLQNGGPSGLIYGFLFTVVGYSCVAASMGELVSLWPTAGGQYHWVYMLAPARWKTILSYFVGWQSVIAWQATAAGGCYVSATAIQGLVINSQPSYAPQRWHGTLMAVAIVSLCCIFSIFLSKGLPFTEIAALWLHILLFIALLVILTVMSPAKASSHDVWANILNDGGYESKGVSFFVGLITSVFAFSGVDGAVHMCEEVHNASRIVPWAMMGSVLINGIAGFGMLVATLYCLGDVDAAISTPTGYPFIEIFTSASRSIVGGTAISAFITVMFILGTLSLYTSTSRQLWAFARDNAVPNARFISYVHPRLKVPVVSIVVTTLISALLSIINVGSTMVFNALISLSVSGFFASYILPFAFLMYVRVKRPHDLPHAPWNLGRYGPFVNGFAVVWSMLICFWSFWPQNIPVTATNMNWSVVLFSEVNIFAILFWMLHGRKVYTGPVVETQLEGPDAREGATVGKEV